MVNTRKIFRYNKKLYRRYETIKGGTVCICSGCAFTKNGRCLFPDNESNYIACEDFEKFYDIIFKEINNKS